MMTGHRFRRTKYTQATLSLWLLKEEIQALSPNEQMNNLSVRAITSPDVLNNFDRVLTLSLFNRDTCGAPTFR